MGDWLRKRKNATPAEVEQRVRDVREAVWEEFEPNSSGTRVERLAAAQRAEQAGERARVLLLSEVEKKTAS